MQGIKNLWKMLLTTPASQMLKKDMKPNVSIKNKDIKPLWHFSQSFKYEEEIYVIP